MKFNVNSMQAMYSKFTCDTKHDFILKYFELNVVLCIHPKQLPNSMFVVFPCKTVAALYNMSYINGLIAESRHSVQYIKICLSNKNKNRKIYLPTKYYFNITYMLFFLDYLCGKIIVYVYNAEVINYHMHYPIRFIQFHSSICIFSIVSMLNIKQYKACYQLTIKV